MPSFVLVYADDSIERQMNVMQVESSCTNGICLIGKVLLHLEMQALTGDPVHSIIVSPNRVLHYRDGFFSVVAQIFA